MGVNSLVKTSLVWELHCEGIPKLHIADKLRVGRASVYRWLGGIDRYGGLNLSLGAYQITKKGRGEKEKLTHEVKRYVWRLREEHRGCCSQKIQYHLDKERGIYLGVKTIYNILSEKYKLRTQWKKNMVRGPVPHAKKPHEVVQMDTVDFGRILAFCGIDIFAKDASVKLYPSLTSLDGLDFLRGSMAERFKHANLLQVDGGPEFKGEFRANVSKYTDRFRVIRPYKKNEKSYIEVSIKA